MEVGAQLDLTAEVADGRMLALPDLYPYLRSAERMLRYTAAEKGRVLAESPRFFLTLTDIGPRQKLMLRALADTEDRQAPLAEIPAQPKKLQPIAFCHIPDCYCEGTSHP